jgi:hypothetical protein
MMERCLRSLENATNVKTMKKMSKKRQVSITTGSIAARRVSVESAIASFSSPAKTAQGFTRSGLESQSQRPRAPTRTSIAEPAMGQVRTAHSLLFTNLISWRVKPVLRSSINSSPQSLDTPHSIEATRFSSESTHTSQKHKQPR